MFKRDEPRWPRNPYATKTPIPLLTHCRRCKMNEDQHIEGKCLFEPGEFYGFSEADYMRLDEKVLQAIDRYHANREAKLLRSAKRTPLVKLEDIIDIKFSKNADGMHIVSMKIVSRRNDGAMVGVQSVSMPLRLSRIDRVLTTHGLSCRSSRGRRTSVTMISGRRTRRV